MTFEYTGYFHIYSISFLVVYAYFPTPTFYFILTKEKSSLDKLTTHCIKEKKWSNKWLSTVLFVQNHTLSNYKSHIWLLWSSFPIFRPLLRKLFKALYRHPSYWSDYVFCFWLRFILRRTSYTVSHELQWSVSITCWSCFKILFHYCWPMQKHFAFDISFLQLF